MTGLRIPVVPADPAGPLTPRWRSQLETMFRTSLGLTADDALLIVWDGLTERGLVEDLLAVGREIAADAAVAHYLPQTALPLSRYCYFAMAALEPTVQLPTAVAGALATADAVVFVLSDLEVLFSAAVGEAATRGRVLMLPYADRASAQRLLPSGSAEAEALQNLTVLVGEHVRAARTAHVTSPAGTDLRLEFGTDSTCVYGGRRSSGEVQILPGGQVSRMPAEGTANGRLVIDRSIAHGRYRALDEPIELLVEDGYVTGVAGGAEAAYLTEFLDGLGHPGGRHLTELGVGLNPRCDLVGVNAPAEDTHAIGTCSFALGCDTHLGGVVAAPVHVDMTMHVPTVTIEDVVLIRDGSLTGELPGSTPLVDALAQARTR